MKYFLFIAFFLKLSVIVSHALSTLELRGGASVTGEVLSEQTDKVVIDLGFTVLSVPRSAVLSVVGVDATEVESSVFAEGSLFEHSKRQERFPIKDWVRRQGEAVVLIRTSSGLGSGFVIHPEGYIVTNDHVIAGEHEISVTVFGQGEGTFEKAIYQNVRIVASSSEMDLALLKLEDTEERQFLTVPLGESDVLNQGQTVFAIGSPLGLDRSVSEGIISIKNRPIGGRIYIQTTTEINPGNSGGPLFNLKGEVVGVNNMKIVAMGAEGLGFAIPSSMLKVFLNNREAFSFDPRNPNSGFRYNEPPRTFIKQLTPGE